MEALKPYRWYLIGIISVVLVAVVRVHVLPVSRFSPSWPMALFLAWLCTPNRQLKSGRWTVWFAAWWLALTVVAWGPIGEYLSGDGSTVSGLLMATLVVRIFWALWTDKRDRVREEKAGLGQP